MHNSAPVIDVHLHLDERVGGPAENAVRALIREMDATGVARGVVLHLATQRWALDEVSAALRPVAGRLTAFANIDPTAEDALGRLKSALGAGFAGLKMHPRLQQYAADDSRAIALARGAGELGAPVLIDAFPDGTALMDGFNVLRFARLAQAAPRTRFIVAHMAGHHVLDMLMLAKRIPNLYFDFSYSLLYYRASAVPQNMVYAMRSLRFSRVFYGSDYPDRPLDETLRASVEVLNAHGVGAGDQHKLLYENAKDFFGWTDI